MPEISGSPVTFDSKASLQSGSAFPFDDSRRSDEDHHDPNIVRFGDSYILIATSHIGFIPIWTSTDLIHWNAHGPLLPETPEWLTEKIPAHRSVWAPAPLKVGEMLRIYYCASERFGANSSYIGMVENAAFNPGKPTEGWVDRGMLVQSRDGIDRFNAIDPDVVVGPDGRVWMVYGSYWGGMFLVELDPNSGLIRDPGKPHLHVASNTGETGNPLEAPCLRYHEGFYYLFVTYGLAAQGVRSTYRTMVGRSRLPEGPYLGYDDRPMTEGGHTDLIKSSPPMFGPGGGNAFIDELGEWWLAYHYYDSRVHWHHDVWGKPAMQIRRLVWGDDGWPLPGLPIDAELGQSSIGLVGTWLQQGDFGSVNELELDSGGRFRSGGQAGKWTLENDRLKFESSDNGQELCVHIDKSLQYYVGRDKFGAVIRGIKRHAEVRKL